MTFGYGTDFGAPAQTGTTVAAALAHTRKRVRSFAVTRTTGVTGPC